MSYGQTTHVPYTYKQIQCHDSAEWQRGDCHVLNFLSSNIISHWLRSINKTKYATQDRQYAPGGSRTRIPVPAKPEKEPFARWLYIDRWVRPSDWMDVLEWVVHATLVVAVIGVLTSVCHIHCRRIFYLPLRTVLLLKV